MSKLIQIEIKKKNLKVKPWFTISIERVLVLFLINVQKITGNG